MKRSLLLITLIMVLPAVRGQPLVNFANKVTGSVNAPTYSVDPQFPFVQWCGESGMFAGPLVSGSGYTAELLGGPLGSTEGALTSLGTTIFRTGASAGSVQSVLLPIMTVAMGQRATFQVRVWENLGGAVTNWAQAQLTNCVARGSSALFSPPDSLGAVPLNLVGLGSFNLVAPASLTNVMPNCVPTSRSTIAWFGGPLSQSELDLDRDGTPDVRFWAEQTQCTGDFPPTSCYTPFKIAPLATNQLLLGTNELWIHPAGFSSFLLSNVTWSTTTQTLTAYWNSPHYGVDGWTTPLGKWGGGYLGVQFHAADGWHYGWVHAQLPSTPGFAGGPIITDWAYETRPGIAICTGARPLVIPIGPPEIVRPSYIRLRWISEVNKAYQVQSKSEIGVPGWTNLDITIVATSTNCVVDIPIVGARRFFRVVETE